MNDACINCGAPHTTDCGWCIPCLRAEVCCPDEPTAARRLCGCRGRAGNALRRALEMAA